MSVFTHGVKHGLTRLLAHFCLLSSAYSLTSADLLTSAYSLTLAHSILHTHSLITYSPRVAQSYSLGDEQLINCSPTASHSSLS